MGDRKILLFLEKSSSCGELINALDAQDWTVYQTTSVSEAIKLSTKFQFNVALALLNTCGNIDFIDQIEEVASHDSKTNWIFILPECDDETPVEILRKHKLIEQFCFDYHHQPIHIERLQIIMGHAYGMAQLSRTPLEFDDNYYAKFGMVGKSPHMIELFSKIDKVAKEKLSILILGETGTGKELIARAIHANSPRAHKPFIAVNCGTLPEHLVQTELFGHEKGAFTGAHKSKIGRIESAHRGTLFLDEIGDLPLNQQVNLLRFLEEKTIIRVGGEKHVPVDVRVIAATNVDLKAAINEREFREDLFYRLSELQLKTPPLRERNGDVETLAQFFFNKFISDSRKRIKGFSLGALYAINTYDWPGNVRELANSIRKAIIMSDNRLISPDDLDLNHHGLKNKQLNTIEEARAEADRNSIIESLKQSNNNITHAAKKLGVSRVTLHRLMDKYQIKVLDVG